MIDGFEQETGSLTGEERLAMAHIVRGLLTKVGEEQAVTSGKIIAGMKGMGITLTEPRVRKIINNIRRNKAVRNLVATSKGYYIETNKDRLEVYVHSLRQRAAAIQEVADSYDTMLP